jgi:hypothetical protein
MRADIHDGPEQRSNERPDTLMQDHHLPGRQKNPLQRTAGPYIGSDELNRSRSRALRGMARPVAYTGERLSG